MKTTQAEPRLRRVTGPTVEPVSVADAKKQLEIASSDSSHDDQITNAIVAAREQLEHDTQYVTTTQTFEVLLDRFPASDGMIRLPLFPIQSLTSIEYTNEDEAAATVSTTVADVDRAKRHIRLKWDQEWPDCSEQRDAVVVTVVAGYGSQAAVPKLVKQAILLQVTKWFEFRGDEVGKETEYDVAYERIIRRLMRENYP